MRDLTLKHLKNSLTHHFELTRELVATDFKLMYKHSILGILWLIIQPTLNFLILYFVWANLFHTKADYGPKLLAGIAVYTLFSSIIKMGMNSLYSKKSIILKVNFRRELVVLSSSLVAFINFLLTMIPLVIILYMAHIHVYLKGVILYGLVVWNIYFIGLSFALVLSIVMIRVRDIKHIIELVLQMLYWGTPVMYDMSRLKGQSLAVWVGRNPLTPFFETIKLAIVHSDKVLFNDYFTQFAYFLFIIPIFILSLLFFEKYIYKVAEYY